MGTITVGSILSVGVTALSWAKDLVVPAITTAMTIALSFPEQQPQQPPRSLAPSQTREITVRSPLQPASQPSPRPLVREPSQPSPRPAALPTTAPQTVPIATRAVQTVLKDKEAQTIILPTKLVDNIRNVFSKIIRCNMGKQSLLQRFFCFMSSNYYNKLANQVTVLTQNIKETLLEIEKTPGILKNAQIRADLTTFLTACAIYSSNTQANPLPISSNVITAASVSQFHANFMLCAIEREAPAQLSFSEGIGFAKELAQMI